MRRALALWAVGFVSFTALGACGVEEEGALFTGGAAGSGGVGNTGGAGGTSAGGGAGGTSASGGTSSGGGSAGSGGGAGSGGTSATGGAGGTTGGSGGTSGGGGGTSGGSGGATGGSGGATGGSGGATGGSGGTVTGGTGGIGGSATGGSGGSGGTLVTACPSTQPSNNSTCSTIVVGCKYGGTQCGCWGGQWHCNPCSATSPPTGSCTTGWACNYGSTACGCDYPSPPSWNCLVCPSTKPGDETACADQNAVCAYGASYCVCRWDGSNLRWNCP